MIHRSKLRVAAIGMMALVGLHSGASTASAVPLDCSTHAIGQLTAICSGYFGDGLWSGTVSYVCNPNGTANVLGWSCALYYDY